MKRGLKVRRGGGCLLLQEVTIYSPMKRGLKEIGPARLTGGAGKLQSIPR